MASDDLFAVVMAGGSGTRFWPASRKARPKQFLPIGGDRAMLTETVARIAPLVATERTLVVTAESQLELAREALPALPAENFLAEPTARNTAPCVAWAAQEVERRSPGAVQVVLPADHVIEPAESFRRTIAAAATTARASDVLVTLGVKPTSPHTGYGYIEAADTVGSEDGIDVQAVARFVEKPDQARAEEFLRAGNFFWNAGIFVWRTSTILAAVREHAPELAAGIDEIAGGAPLADVYPKLPAEPVDIAIMERASNVRMLPIDYRWDDVGSWAALPGVHGTDDDGNCVVGAGSRTVAIDAKGCITFADAGRVVALVGVDDLIVVQTEDATLVCPKDRAQDVKTIVERLGGEAPEFL